MTLVILSYCCVEEGRRHWKGFVGDVPKSVSLERGERGRGREQWNSDYQLMIIDCMLQTLSVEGNRSSDGEGGRNEGALHNTIATFVS